MLSWPFPRAENLPTYGFVITDAVKARVRATGADIIDLGLGNPDRPTPGPIVERLLETAVIGKNHRYHPGRGLLPLREAAAAWYEKRYGVRFDVEQELVITMGAKEGMSNLCLAILDRGDLALAPDPCYPIHAGAPRIAGADVELYRASLDIAPADAVAESIARAEKSGRRVKLVIANYPQNPTGQVISREQMGALVRVVQRSGAMLLHDLAYADFDFASRHAPSIFDCGVPADEVKAFAVETFSMSKSYNMPGWRIAFMAGNARLVGALAHLKTYLDYGTFAPLQYAAAWALEHGDVFAEELRELYLRRAHALVGGLRQAGWEGVTEPSGTMFVWAKVPRALSQKGSLDATTRLIEQAHVAVAPGVGFGPGGDGHVRFALIEDPPRIAEACERIGRLFAVPRRAAGA
ncbi:MAG TPA: aminotransferase class I/II-fold pyridoxal phosphate-dependent enzyme [Polyangiaceae bacterium]|nr:aminotransferase class I/II-fold pyridoxal phosphate-dependent enzyme [Polyangiaceae bacterium]